MKLRTAVGVVVALVSLALGCGSGESDRDPSATPSPVATSTPMPTGIEPTPTAAPVLWVTGCGADARLGCGCTHFGDYCERGVLARSDDAGRTWTRQYVDAGLGSVAFASALDGWAVGPGGVVLHTVDGGVSWARKDDGIELPAEATARGVNAFDVVRFLDARRGIISGWGTTDEVTGHFGPVTLYRTQAFVLLTEDGGESWRPAPIDGAPAIDGGRGAAACFTDSGIGVIARERTPLLLSRDAGRTWQSTPATADVPRALDVACEGNESIGLSGSGGVVRSADGGLTWTALGNAGYDCCYAPLDFTSELRGWRAGNDVQRTDDGGSTWITVDAALPPGFEAHALRFATADEGLWVADGAGGVTHDGGLTWEPVIVVPFRDGIFNLTDIAVVDTRAR